MSNGWGGGRVGAGKKPEAKPLSLVEGNEANGLCLPPSDLPPDQQAFWRDYAPLAVERSTLTESTVPAFRLLCELHAKKAMIGTMVDKGALGGIRVFMQLAKQVESLMARFCLAPFGKPAKTERAKPAANPWSQVIK
jgi:hypothetical protein